MISDDAADPPARQVLAAGPDSDPLLAEDEEDRNRARVGSLRPPALLYTGGIGATVDLPHFSVIVRGTDAWDYVYRRQPPQRINEPRLLAAVQRQLGRSVTELRQLPWRQGNVGDHGGAEDLGVPVWVFPQWLRCTGCDLLATVGSGEFTFDNHNPFRPDQAVFQHERCSGRRRRSRSGSEPVPAGRQPRVRAAVSARYLLACQNGHLDEFPYLEWVHRATAEGWACRDRSGRLVRSPKLLMAEYRSNLGPMVTLECASCGQTRTMKEATATGAARKLPPCRGRQPHLGNFEKCGEPTRLMLLGASNQWFPATIGMLDLTTGNRPTVDSVATHLAALPPDVLDAATSPDSVRAFRLLVQHEGVDLSGVDDHLLWQAVTAARTGTPAAAEQPDLGPVGLLQPEWDALRQPERLTNLSERAPFRVVNKQVPATLSPALQKIVAVEKLKKVNAFLGFTRIDPLDRISDARRRLAPMSRAGAPTWVPATQDHGEGIFLQLDEDLVGPWEEKVRGSQSWAKHREAHFRNFKRRLSQTAEHVDPHTRLPPPRYWALHTLAHLLIRQIALHAGYGSSSLAERIYAWDDTAAPHPAAGILVSTTAPDSEGTLGGLVELTKPATMDQLVIKALQRAERCSSDPICAGRLPEDHEDFLHGAACHFCTFLAETSCENANRFLDRRFVLTLAATGEFAGLLQGLLDG